MPDSGLRKLLQNIGALLRDVLADAGDALPDLGDYIFKLNLIFKRILPNVT